MKRVLAASACALALAAPAADPVAFVADLRGNATIEGDGKLVFLAELNPGTRLLLGTGALVSVTYASTGAEFTFGGPGEFLVTGTEVRADKGAPPTRRNVAVLRDPAVVARVARTATASIRMRSAAQDASKTPLEYPVDARIATLQPTLRWKGGEAATVSVVDAKGKEVWKGNAQPSMVRPAMKLSPATIYTWTGAAARTFTDRVMHAFLLQDLGATQDAREAWAALSRERPDLPELAVLAR